MSETTARVLQLLGLLQARRVWTGEELALRLPVTTRSVRLRYQLPASVVAQHFSPQSATVEPDGTDACVLTAGGDDPETLVLYLARVGDTFEVLEPSEVRDAARVVSQRLRRAAGPP